ncbi:hypothetical protein [Clostridium saccharobutylicum]|uniref:Uncharacterized protein n=1 Tax=Clostridium saccharobutylicum DSM 13864 TaxID=1345695 RepID=U5MYN6_CLOSA|nr:hypothetical protein [Clostridium saccharobutylicum]AGX44771.1 hypothetical protein CLSA_c38100 [Clostridium saccharobutylicum DSM 13864]AQR92058.1 hypothetical protein CLOSC_37860 [Clostridium saccharobutylicum]AQS01960.1 hypothetical protein CSACC_37910 [Clostridium saccharobutylicum]AQS11562.1 hypothetical protein CLOBY_37180 [Clostridium saccharobutylicum]AQS15943.1 hypothetical protein CLOSACC_37910 [Clostridium saccharobutylicum]
MWFFGRKKKLSQEDERESELKLTNEQNGIRLLNDDTKEKLLQLKSEVQKIEDFINIRIFALDDLENKQIGYSIDSDGNSLVSDEQGSWKSEWIVIGNEVLCGDPIIIDATKFGVPVSLLTHGMGDWTDGINLSESLDKFTNEIKSINNFIYKKAEQNIVPRITCRELDNLIENIIKDDKYGDADNWKSMLNQIYESTKEYEDNITKKVKKRYDDGVKIKEISDELNMNSKDIYKYLRRKIGG